VSVSVSVSVEELQRVVEGCLMAAAQPLVDRYHLIWSHIACLDLRRTNQSSSTDTDTGTDTRSRCLRR
jgi:hypothetical protein